jgi:hypothetical protein
MFHQQRRNVMQRVKVSKSVMWLIEQERRGSSFGSMATELPDGCWEIEVDDDTITHVKRNALRGESFSDTVERLIMGRRFN